MIQNQAKFISSVAVAFGLAAILSASPASAGFSLPSFGKKKPETAAPVNAARAPTAPAAPAYVPPAQIVLADRIIDQAAAYAVYMDRAGSIRADFKSGASVSAAVKVGQAFEPKQFQHGMIAYSAVVALRDPAFVNQMRTYAADPRQRELIANQLMGDPNYVAAIPGADSAAGLVLAALSAQSSRVRAAGVAVKQSAYDVQHQAWSKQPVANRDARLADAKLISTNGVVMTAEDRSRIVAIPMGGELAGVTANSVRGPYSPSVARGLAIAALAVLGKAGEENIGQIGYLLVNNNDGFCLSMSKLNLYQCLSVAKPHYEDIFCLGQHVLLDTAGCVEKAAGGGSFGALAKTVIAAAGPASVVSTAAPLSSNK